MKRWLAMGMFSLVAAGCATTTTASSTPPVLDREALLERATDHVAYRRAPEEVLSVVRALLDERGYTVEPSADPLYVRTGWKVDGNPDIASRGSRLLVYGQKLDDGRLVVRVYEQVNTRESLAVAPVVTRRVADLEWELLSRLEPHFAQAVERQVDVYVHNHQPPEELEVDP